MGLHLVLYLASDNNSEGDSNGVSRAGDRQDVFIVDLLDLDVFCFGSLGANFPIDYSLQSHSWEGEGKQKKADDCKFVSKPDISFCALTGYFRSW